MTKDNAHGKGKLITNPNRSLLILVAAAILAGTAAGVARGDLLAGDPRQCSYNDPRQCANSAAKTTLVRYMRTHGHPSWSNPVTCTQAGATSLLKWRCSFGTGTAAVWFRPLSTGWKRVVTVTMNP